ncbi:MAG: VacJ family lipoprotein [Gammaproteobacteria bacterium]|nr:VacJ family lipoprotein [Gammaproteobacteria bacterium]MDH5591635.1 VacJ family lipoprotein [Gammaproteobacteria bacterium]
MSKLTMLIRINMLAIALIMSGCATTQHSEGVNDPLEGYNRAMYKFNDLLDRAITKPAAKGYDAIVPDPISKGISNFFSNLNEITVILNDLLQLKFGQAFHDTGRFVLNSTVGVAGLFDVAGYSGYEKHDEDFGQTLGVWGVKPGPYFVLPFFGPRNIRDTFGLIGDAFTDPVNYLDDPATRNGLYALRIIDNRANLLSVEKVLDEAAIDEYSYVRGAYLQRRQNLVYDGNPPEEDFDVFSD